MTSERIRIDRIRKKQIRIEISEAGIGGACTVGAVSRAQTRRSNQQLVIGQAAGTAAATAWTGQRARVYHVELTVGEWRIDRMCTGRARRRGGRRRRRI